MGRLTVSVSMWGLSSQSRSLPLASRTVSGAGRGSVAASSSSTLRRGSSLSRAAATQPPEPPPMMMTS